MELKDFVKKVLLDLVQAVEEVRGESVRDMRLSNHKGERTVEFDIAVSAESSSGLSGKAGVRVLQFAEAGGDINKEAKNSTVSRVRFGIDIDSLTKEEDARQMREMQALNSGQDGLNSNFSSF
ncbi:hypothetical protein KJ836_02090 [Patescibacteria group bacterium]|nr:hypothetical protein [Patescibacteria group bacterium]